MALVELELFEPIHNIFHAASPLEGRAGKAKRGLQGITANPTSKVAFTEERICWPPKELTPQVEGATQVLTPDSGSTLP